MTSPDLEGPASTADGPSLNDLFAVPAVAALLAVPSAWWIWSAAGDRLVATNPAGARAMGLPDPARAIGRVYPAAHPFAAQVARLAAGLGPGGEARPGRLRVFGRFGSENAVCEAQRIGAGTAEVVVVRLARTEAGDPQATVAETLKALGLEAVPAGIVEPAPAGVADAVEPQVDARPAPTGLAGPERVGPEASATGAPAIAADEAVGTGDAKAATAGDATAAEEGPSQAALPVEPVLVEPLPVEPVSVEPLPVEAEAGAVAEEPAPRTVALPAPASTPGTNADSGLAVPVRFAWRLDGEGRFHGIDQPDLGAPAGLTLPEAADRFGMDPTGQLARTVAAARPFSGVPAIWPLGTSRRLSVTLAAFPSLREGAAPSYAGFGLVVEEVAPAAAPEASDTGEAGESAGGSAPVATLLVEAVTSPAVDEASTAGQTPDGAAPAVEPPAVVEPDAPGAIASGTTPEPAPDVEAPAPVADGKADIAEQADEASAAGLSGPSAGDQPEPAAPSPATAAGLPADGDAAAARAPEGEGRPQLTVHTKPANVVALRSSAGVDVKRTTLSPGERNAFREIARALGARTEDDGTPVTPAAEAPAESVSPVGIGDADAAPEAVETSRLAGIDASGTGEAGTDDMAGRPEAPDLSGAEAGTRSTERAGSAERPEAAPLPEAGPAAPAADDAIDTGPAAPAADAPDAGQPVATAGVPDLAAEPLPAAPPAPAFVESGTPYGPLPSAFGGLASPAAPAAGVISPALGLLDRVPLGLVVHRGNAVLFANRTLLDWVGLADAGALEAAGGIARLFAGEGQDQRGDSAAPVRLRAEGSKTMPVEARLSRVSWEGEPAFLFAITRLPEEAAGETETLGELRGRLDEVEQILDTATDGIVLVTADGAIESMNRSAEALFGYDAGDMKGRSLTALFAPESHRSVLDYCDGLLSNGVASVLNDGRQVIGRVRQGGLIPLYMTMGRTGPAARPKLAAVFRDMSQWKKAEEDLIAARRQAEQASSQKSDFLAKISHEIRTPLNAIIGFSEVMIEERFGPIGNERYRDYLKDIHASGGHVLSLINDLLDLSKIEAGRLELAFTSVDLNDIVQSTVAIMQPQANRERVIIRSSLHQRLPNVVADARSLRQIVLNLLSNSVKFTPAGGQIIISTALSEAGEAVMRVRDTGVGMTESELKAAMEPFRQVATTTGRGAKGTGLGLPLTKALVEANRASFGISSTPNQGTLVEVVFPPTRVLAE